MMMQFNQPNRLHRLPSSLLDLSLVCGCVGCSLRTTPRLIALRHLTFMSETLAQSGLFLTAALILEMVQEGHTHPTPLQNVRG